MKFSLFLLVVACLAVAGCSEFPGVLHLTTNPEGAITAGVTIQPSK